MGLLYPVLRSLPAPALRRIGAVREIGLKLLGPVDRWQRAGTASARLPPLWLRRHSGPLGKVESAASEMAALLRAMDQVRADDLVLDVGCGPGAMAPWFGRMLGSEGRYVGFDSYSDSVDWCRARFRDDPRFRFDVADATARFPLGDGEAGFTLAKSVFTHLTAPEARSCLSEIRRVLAPGRTAVVTVFLFERGGGEARAALYFPFADEDASARWRWKARPRSAIAFHRPFFEDMVERSGLRVALFRSGFFPGAERPRGQDVLFLAHQTAPLCEEGSGSKDAVQE